MYRALAPRVTGRVCDTGSAERGGDLLGPRRAVQVATAGSLRVRRVSSPRAASRTPFSRSRGGILAPASMCAQCPGRRVPRARTDPVPHARLFRYYQEPQLRTVRRLLTAFDELRRRVVAGRRTAVAAA
jgi:hypothetical protein